MSNVTFATKCWQGDYRKILDIDYIRKMVCGNSHSFSTIKIWLNNFDDSLQYQIAEKLLQDLIDKYSMEIPLRQESMRERVKEFPEVTSFFNSEPLKYSACEYLSTKIETTPTLWTCGDILVRSNFDWVSVGLKLLDENSDLLSVTPCTHLGWAQDLKVAITPPPKLISTIETGFEKYYPYFLVSRYSDHCNLYFPERMQKIQFGEVSPTIDGSGPNYWFEVHVCAWMENHKIYRAVLGASPPGTILYYGP